MAFTPVQDTTFNPLDYANAPVSEVDSISRLAFVRRTYVHLFVAVLAFVLIEFALFATPLPGIMMAFLGNTPLAWLLVLGGFMAVGWIAERWAHSDTSRGMQYAGLGLYVLAEAVIFLPLLAMASVIAPSAVPTAAVATIVLFGGMTASTFLTKHDFSWMGPMLAIGGIAALLFIVVSMFTGMSDGLYLFFTCAMIFFACGYILYTTSQVMHHYRTDQHVAASLALFAALALLFWYLVQLFMHFDD